MVLTSTRCDRRSVPPSTPAAQQARRTRMSTVSAAKVPPGPRLPKPLAAVAVLAFRETMIARFRRRYGDAFTVELPVFGRTVVVSSPDLVKQMFQAKPDVLAFGA